MKNSNENMKKWSVICINWPSWSAKWLVTKVISESFKLLGWTCVADSIKFVDFKNKYTFREYIKIFDNLESSGNYIFDRSLISTIVWYLVSYLMTKLDLDDTNNDVNYEKVENIINIFKEKIILLINRTYWKIENTKKFIFTDTTLDKFKEVISYRQEHRPNKLSKRDIFLDKNPSVFLCEKYVYYFIYEIFVDLFWADNCFFYDVSRHSKEEFSALISGDTDKILIDTGHIEN